MFSYWHSCIITGWMWFNNHSSFKPTQCKHSKQQLQRERNTGKQPHLIWIHGNLSLNSKIEALYLSVCVTDRRGERSLDVLEVYLRICGSFWHHWVYFWVYFCSFFTLFLYTLSIFGPFLRTVRPALAQSVSVWCSFGCCCVTLWWDPSGSAPRII